MNEILFEVLKSVIILVLILIVRYAVPYIQQITEKSRYDMVLKWVTIAVHSAEQTIFGEKSGPEKKEIVTQFLREQLQKKNIALSEEQLHNLIEAVVFEMKNGEIG